MKKISREKLDKLVKDEGWALNTESARSLHFGEMVSGLKELVGYVGMIKETLEGMSKGGGDGADSQPEILKNLSVLSGSIKSLIQAGEARKDGGSSWKFKINRGRDGLIKSIDAEKDK